MHTVPANTICLHLRSERRTSSDEIVNFAGLHFKISYSYPRSTAKVERNDDSQHIYFHFPILECCWLRIPLPGVVLIASATSSTNPWGGALFNSFPLPHGLSLLQNSILIRRARYKGNNHWARGSRRLCFEARFF